ncbi:di-trans,poly-cis-decaprenylcistransferase [Ruminococcaceae bacterium OttesenSCG-928-L11]|nr:di-trans,poly-cis-decaprenylcistransferase [Ruminococcaceae bacterium OttesenSCG-928-L11]
MSKAIQATDPAPVPRHVGIIMDGNGRWAKKRGLPRKVGHKAGAEALKNLVPHTGKRGVEVLTVYAFSTENWNRPAEEINALVDLMKSYLKEAPKYFDRNLRVEFPGDYTVFGDDLARRIEEAKAHFQAKDGPLLNIALNYGGRDEIVHAAKELLRRYERGEIADIDKLGHDDIARHLYTAGQPDVDLIIRTSGEKRLSNFMLWQSSYAEYYYTDTLWPDFTPAEFDKALEAYASRSRRMGGV